MRRVATALLIGLLVVFLFAGCGGGDGDGDGDAAGTTTETSTGQTAETAGDPAAGEEVFAAAGCGNCHVLDEAGSSGTTGPSLEDEELDLGEVAEQVREGGGGMPSFEDDLSETEINDVAAFVAQSSGDG